MIIEITLLILLLCVVYLYRQVCDLKQEFYITKQAFEALNWKLKLVKKTTPRKIKK